MSMQNSPSSLRTIMYHTRVRDGEVLPNTTLAPEGMPMGGMPAMPAGMPQAVPQAQALRPESPKAVRP